MMSVAFVLRKISILRRHQLSIREVSFTRDRQSCSVSLTMNSSILFYSFVLLQCILAQDSTNSEFNFAELFSEDSDDGRVVGGYRTSIEEHPYQVSLRIDGQYRCGAAIISNEWVITAAHCLRSVFPSSISVKAGSSTLGGRGQVSNAKDIIIHEDYAPRKSDFDIALIQLETSFDYNDKVQAIDLAEFDDDDSSGSTATVSGWGIVERNGRISNYLREVTVPLISNDECTDLYGKNRITERMLCAGYVGRGGKDACQGDSGGPLVQAGKLIGIVSWGFGCGEPSYPGVYTRVTALRSWISEKTGI